MTSKKESAPGYGFKSLAERIYEKGEYCECVRDVIDYLYAKFSDFAETAPPNIDGDILRDNLDDVYEHMTRINVILDGSSKEISVTEKSELSIEFLGLLIAINNSTNFAGDTVKYQKENEEIQRLVSKATAMRDKKALKSKRISEAVEKHARDHLKSHARKETPHSIGQAIEKAVSADLAKDGVRPIGVRAIAKRIREAGGVISYKT